MKRIILGIFFTMKLAVSPQAEATIVHVPSAPMKECSMAEADLEDAALYVKTQLAMGQ